VVYDVKAKPRRLNSADILAKRSTDWILDIQRSSQVENHFYILTTSRVFWLEVTSAGEDELGNHGGSHVLLSYRHFRDANDETMKLMCLKSEKGMSLIWKYQSFTNFHEYMLRSPPLDLVRSIYTSFKRTNMDS
jgi:RNA polymerase I-specific transcription initiation factor RRN6